MLKINMTISFQRMIYLLTTFTYKELGIAIIKSFVHKRAKEDNSSENNRPLNQLRFHCRVKAAPASTSTTTHERTSAAGGGMTCSASTEEGGAN